MRCDSLASALGYVKARPGEAFKLTDESGRTARLIYGETFGIYYAKSERHLSCTPAAAENILSFMLGAVTVEEADTVGLVVNMERK